MPINVAEIQTGLANIILTGYGNYIKILLLRLYFGFITEFWIIDETEADQYISGFAMLCFMCIDIYVFFRVEAPDWLHL